MADVTETLLPGVGVRHDFTTAAGEQIAVLSYRTGRRELVVYDRADADRSAAVLHLSASDAQTLAEVLGASQVSTTVAAVQHHLEGLAIDWLTVPPESRFASKTIADGAFRTTTGASIVAVVRGDVTIAAPGPDFRFEPNDIAVAVGTPEGLAQLSGLLSS